MNDHICSGYRYEVIVVEDNSPDGTYEVAVELQVWNEMDWNNRIESIWWREDSDLKTSW